VTKMERSPESQIRQRTLHFVVRPDTSEYLEIPPAVFSKRSHETGLFDTPPGLRDELRRASQKESSLHGLKRCRREAINLTRELFPRKSKEENEEVYWGRALSSWRRELEALFPHNYVPLPETVQPAAQDRREKILRLLQIGEKMRVAQNIVQATDPTASSNPFHRHLNQTGKAHFQKELSGVPQWLTPFLNIASDHFLQESGAANVLAISDHLTPLARHYKHQVLMPVYRPVGEKPAHEFTNKDLALFGLLIMLLPALTIQSVNTPLLSEKLAFSLFEFACFSLATNKILKFEKWRIGQKT